MPSQTLHHITDRQLADLLCSALEGGSNYWIERVDVHEGKGDGKPWGTEYTPSYMSAPFSTNGFITIRVSDEDDDQSHQMKRLNRPAMNKGLQILLEKYPHHYADFLAENHDSITADAFLQCALFGEIIFG